MMIELLKSKIHRARITGADVNYVGSLTLDPDLARRAGLVEYERVLVASLKTGRRLETYVILGKRGSREVVTNGAAAKVIKAGERVIVMAFAHVPASRARGWKPKVLVLDAQNRPV